MNFCVFTEGHPALHLSDLSVQMDQQHRFGSRSQATLHAGEIEKCHPRIDISQNQRRSSVHNGKDGSNGCHRCGNDFVAGADVQRAQAKFNGVHSIADAGTEFCATKFRPRFLKLFHFIPKNEPARAQNAFDRGQFLRLGCENRSSESWCGIPIMRVMFPVIFERTR